MFRKYLHIPLYLILSCSLRAQPSMSGLNPAERVFEAPDSVLSRFRNAGMHPTNHELTAIEKEKIEHAFAALPPLHQHILKTHLHSISFLDNMSNTALTSPVSDSDSAELFNISFRAGILHETISEWATQKENTLFESAGNSGYEIKIEAGESDAFVYILLHEATHVVDAVLKITPHLDDKDELVPPTRFTKNIWHKMNVSVSTATDTLLNKTRFRGGTKLPIQLAPDVYRNLSKTPFASLYGMASWFEDIAELESIYHLTKKMNQPFQLIVKKDNTEVFRFTPMKNKLVKKRLRHLSVFYRKTTGSA